MVMNNYIPKVLFIMHMPPPVHGASMVGKYIHDSELVNSKFECYYLNPTTARNLEDVNKFRFGKVFDVFGLIKRIKVKVHEVQPDMVYFTANAAGFPFYKDWLIVKTLQTSLKEEASKRPDHKIGKIVVHYHNKGVATRQDRLLDNWLYKRFFKGIKVMQLSEYLYPDIEKYVRKEDVCFCPNGIPVTCGIKNKNVENLSEDLTPLNILYLSNMMKEKGVMDLLEACFLLKKRGVDFQCDFVGGWKDVSEDSFKIKVSGFKLEDYVTAHGPKYGDEKEEYWQKADVLVFPTYYHNECFPLVLLEAMEHGVACVSTKEAAIPSIIKDPSQPSLIGQEFKDTGLLVSRKNPQALADALEKLANNRKLCHDMGIAGREKFVKEYTLEVFEKKFVECIKWAMK